MTRRVIDVIPGPDWAALFTGAKDSLFRLEGGAVQDYLAPDEVDAVARFRVGQDPQIDLTWWTSLARSHRDAGRSMSRVRIVVEPPSEYTRFEFIAYPVMAAAGDDIRIISVSPGAWPRGLPREDFWVIDDAVWTLVYDRGGTLLRAELLDDPDAIADHLLWRDIALAQSIPVNDYLAAMHRRVS